MLYICYYFLKKQSTRLCKNYPESFCYIFAEYKIGDNRKPVKDFVKKVFICRILELNLEIKTNSIVCKICVKHLRHWTHFCRNAMRFAIPTVLGNQ